MLRPVTITFAALVSCASLAQAQSAELLTGVRYSDLDLSTNAGASTLIDRLTHAAYEACKYPWGTPVHRKCVAVTVSRSIAALNAPVVTKRYLAQRY